MRAEVRGATLVLALGTASARPAIGQASADGRVLGARRFLPAGGFKVWMPFGRLRLVAWNKDSLVVRGHIGRGENFYMVGDSLSLKFGVEPRESASGSPSSTGSSSLVAYVPHGVRVSVKSVTASVDAAGVAGSFYSV